MRKHGRGSAWTVRAIVTAIGLATVGACGGSDVTSPGTTPALDATALNTTATRIAAITGQPVLSAMMSLGNFPGLPAFSRGVARVPGLVAHAARLVPPAGRSRPQPAASRLLPPAAHGTTASFLPDSLLGKTLVPNAQGGFAVDTSRTGAPASGVRFIIRSAGTTQDLGYADYAESTSGATTTLTLDVKTTAGATLLHDVEATASSGNGDTDAHTGYVTNGTDRIDYSLTSQTVNDRTVETSAVTATSVGVAVADTLVLDGSSAGDVSTARVTVGSTVFRIATPSVPDPDFGGYMPGDSSTVSVNGAPFATIVVDDGGAPKVTSPSGAPLSTNDSQALISVMGIYVSTEMVLLVPLIVSLWLLGFGLGF